MAVRRSLVGPPLALVPLLCVAAAGLGAAGPGQAGLARTALGSALTGAAQAAPGTAVELDPDQARAIGELLTARAAATRAARRVPLAAYSLALPSHPVAVAVASPAGAARLVVPVEERARLERYDATPSVETLYLTLSLVGRSWSITDDRGLPGVGWVSPRSPWSPGADPVTARPSGSVEVLAPASRAGAAQRLAADAEDAVGFVRAAWRSPWPGRVSVEVPASAAALASRIDATFPVDGYTAFAYSTTDPLLDQQGWPTARTAFTGPRVVVQPDQLLGRSVSGRREVLRHELVHVAARAVSGPAVPVWLDEGLAQAVGEGRSPIGASVLAGGAFDGRIPRDDEFLTGDDLPVFRAYRKAYLLVRELDRIGGAGAAQRVYAELGGSGARRAGTPSYQLDRALREVLRVSRAELERRWAADVRAGRLS